MRRVVWDDYWLGVARAVAVRADCTRRKVGAVVVDDRNRVVSTGYNGSAPGGPSCLAGQCPRGRHWRPGQDATCQCGRDWPCPLAVEPGSSYDTGPGQCVAVHAEANALLWADPGRVRGGVLYVTETPCGGCQRLVHGMGVSRVVTPRAVRR